MYTNKEIWNVTCPIFLGLLAQNVINVTDTAFLGHVGEVALGAAAMGGLLYICVYTVAFGFSVGSQILMARRNGEGNYRAVGPIMWQGTAFSLAMAVLLLAVMSFCAAPLIRMLITSDVIYEATYEFFTWRIWGILFSFVNVMFHALYIGITQTRVLTMSAVVMAVVNVFLVMLVCVALCVLFPKSILSVYTNEEALLHESVSALYVVCASLLIAAFANIYFNGISGTGNTQAALVLEVFIQVFYAVYIFVVGMWIQAPVDVCFTTEIVYYVLMLSASLLYLKKAHWQNKKI